ncbi:protein tyrosine phosphatase [Scheffersomyces coipomensis]|uniref:protein tyrosine phosphatase n=1 Tax=Scheffersomyces coipomensis TaxID=1788519 RepID=UPI00315C770C
MSSSPSICASPSFTFPSSTHTPSTPTTSNQSPSCTTTTNNNVNATCTSITTTTTSNDYFFNPKLKPSSSSTYPCPITNTTTTTITNTIPKSTSASSLSSPKHNNQNPFSNHHHIHTLHNNNKPVDSSLPSVPTSLAPPPSIPQPHHHQHHSNGHSISSLSSNLSDLTIYEHSSSHSMNRFKNENSFVSTETLVEANNMNPFFNNDRFVPKHKYNQSLSATSDRSGYLSSFKEEDDNNNDLDNHSSSNNSTRITNSNSSSSNSSSSIPYPRATSAIESSFPFHLSQPLQKVQSLNSHSKFALKKQITLPSLSLNTTNDSTTTPSTPPNNNDLAAFDSIVKNEQLKRLNYLPSQNFKPQIEKLLPQKINYYSLNEISHQIESINTSNNNNLIIDIRPFTDFVKSHIKSSINICLPSTLLKRTNFTLTRCINSLPDFEKFKFHQFLINEKDYDDANLIIYDNLNNSSNLYHFLNKFLDCPNFNNSISNKKIYLMDSNFNQFQLIYPHLLESGPGESMNVNSTSTSTTTTSTTPIPSSFKSSEINLNNYLPPLIVNNRSTSVSNSSPSNTNERSRSQSLAEISPYNRLFSGITPTTNEYNSGSSSIMTSTPILSTNFSLPKIKTNFKIRHNEELGGSNSSNSSNDSSNYNPSFETNFNSKTLQNNHNSLFKLTNIPKDVSKLPLWLRKTVMDDNDSTTSSTKKINDDFYNLEKSEQRRLLHALSLSNPNTSTTSSMESSQNNNNNNNENDDLPPTISCGIEYGHKNRYKDIFLYEHSRVKLRETVNPCVEDYINASYLNPIHNLGDLIKEEKQEVDSFEEYKYIATQGPLDETMGDFWKCIVNLHIPLIISLTDEIENGLIKCSAFWKSGIYKSNTDRINVKIDDEITINEFTILRMFNISIIGSNKVSKVLQIHFLNWPDMGTILSPLDLIQVINLKHHILSEINLTNSSYPTLIHCSAGCGRTGTLCTIDTMINIMNHAKNPLEQDLIYNIVNNFRKQRISMVQNLRQYYLIYEVLLNYLSNDNQIEINHRDDYIHLNIVKLFITQFNELA